MNTTLVNILLVLATLIAVKWCVLQRVWTPYLDITIGVWRIFRIAILAAQIRWDRRMFNDKCRQCRADVGHEHDPRCIHEGVWRGTDVWIEEHSGTHY